MKPLAPEVVAPLGICSTSIEIRGNIAGASIDILVDGSVVSTHASTNADSFYPVGATLAANHKVTARQTISGATSPESLPVTVQDVPGQLSAMTIQTHPHTCGRCVIATGGVPGEKVDVLIGAQIVGSAGVISGYANITYNPPLMAGQKLTLKQTTCNNVTATQTSAAATDPSSPLPAPTIQLPLIECQNSISLSGVQDGAYVEMYRNNVLEDTFTFGVSNEWWWIKPLVKNDVIKVRQGFNCKKPGSPLENPGLYASTVVQPVTSLPKPIFVAAPCPGTTYVTLSNLIPGARVVLSQNGAELGQTDAPTSTYTFTTPPLTSGATLEAHMEMCNGKKGPSGSTVVASQPQLPTGLKISDPYVCAAYVYVAVYGYPGNYLLYITSKSGQQISGYYNLVGFHALVPVSPALLAGDQLTVHVMACGGSWKTYGPFAVKQGAPQPTLVQPVQGGYNFVEVISDAAGAQLDVWVNNLWKGSAISEGNLAVTPVPLSVTLTPGEQVYCIQTLCGTPSKPTATSTVTKQHPKRPVLVAPPNGATNVLVQPSFQWQDPGAGTVAAADSFQLLVTAGGNPVINTPVTGTSLTSPTSLAHSTVFQWNVTASNTGGSESALTPSSFTTQAPPPPPSAVLKFIPPITSNAGGSFPRGQEFVISIGVHNIGNAQSASAEVAAQQRTSDDTQALSAVATAPVPALAPGASALISFPIVINDFNAVRIDMLLLVNNTQADTAFRVV